MFSELCTVSWILIEYLLFPPDDSILVCSAGWIESNPPSLHEDPIEPKFHVASLESHAAPEYSCSDNIGSELEILVFCSSNSADKIVALLLIPNRWVFTCM